MRRHKKNKSYYMGMLTLIFLCALYLIAYPQFRAFETSPSDNSSSSDSAISHETVQNAAQIIKNSDDDTTAAAEAAISAIEEKEKAAQEEETKENVNSIEEETKENADALENEETVALKTYSFRNKQKLSSHFEKHGHEMGFASEQDYLDAANALINNPEALHKNEAEDGDDVYYLEKTNEIAFVSTDGYIRTYFICSGRNYFDRQ